MSIYKKLFEIQKQNLLLSPDADNPFYHSKYVSIENIMNTIKPLLEKEWLLIYHSVDSTTVKTYIYEVESGEYVESTFPINSSLDAQKKGAEITYGKRYNIVALLALIEDDDDGNTASGKTVQSASVPTVPSHTIIPTKSNWYHNKYPPKAPPSKWITKTDIDEHFSQMKSGKILMANNPDSITKEFRDKGIGVSKAMNDYIAEEFGKFMETPF